MSTTTTNHNDIIAAASFVRSLDDDMLWEILAYMTLASDLLVEMAWAEWRFRRPGR